MNFSFSRISKIPPVFATSNVYWTYVLEASNFFHKSGFVFTGRGQVNEPILIRRSATATSSEFTSL